MSLLGLNSMDHQSAVEVIKSEVFKIPKHSIYVLPLDVWVIFGMSKCMQSSSCVDIWRIHHNW